MSRFAKGEKVRRIDGGRSKGRVGTVVGYSRDRECIRVVYDGVKSRTASIHHTFFEKVADELSESQKGGSHG